MALLHAHWNSYTAEDWQHGIFQRYGEIKPLYTADVCNGAAILIDLQKLRHVGCGLAWLLF